MKKIFNNQAFHLLSYISLGSALLLYSEHFIVDSNAFLGLTAFEWIVSSWIVAGIFQFWVMFFWRLELYYNKISAWLGPKGFTLFRIGFVIFGVVRLLPLIPVSFLTRQTVEIHPVLRLSLIIGTTPFILWTLFSVVFYFGINRIFGADHFFPKYRSMSLESRGIFRYIPNPMYTVALLLLYHPGLFWESSPGLVMALIHHLFVWTHYFCTEKPDMKKIYSL